MTYKKFQSGHQKIISNKLYLNDKYFLEKEIITTHCYHPVFKKIITYKIHIGYVTPENYKINYIDLYEDAENSEKIANICLQDRLRRIESKNGYDSFFPDCYKSNELDVFCRRLHNEISDFDFSKELDIYYNKSDKKDLYIFVEAYRGLELLPVFYTVSLFDSEVNYGNSQLNRFNAESLNFFYDTQYFSILDDYDIYDTNISAKYKSIFKELSRIINKHFKHGELSIEELNKLNGKLENEDISAYPFMRVHLHQVFGSFIHYLCIKKVIIVCQNCGQISKYEINKIFCSKRCRMNANNAKSYRKKQLAKNTQQIAGI